MTVAVLSYVKIFRLFVFILPKFDFFAIKINQIIQTNQTIFVLQSAVSNRRYSFSPHSGQNLLLPFTSVPHFGHFLTIAAPHSEQNLALALTVAPQLGQVLPSSVCLAPHSGPAFRAEFSSDFNVRSALYALCGFGSVLCAHTLSKLLSHHLTHSHTGGNAHTHIHCAI